jgi:hypothetical protein
MAVPTMKSVFRSPRASAAASVPDEAIVDIPDHEIFGDPGDPDQTVSDAEMDEIIRELKSRGFVMGGDDVLYHPSHWRVKERGEGELGPLDYFRGAGVAYSPVSRAAKEWIIEHPAPQMASFNADELLGGKSPEELAAMGQEFKKQQGGTDA